MNTNSAHASSNLVLAIGILGQCSNQELLEIQALISARIGSQDGNFPSAKKQRVDNRASKKKTSPNTQQPSRRGKRKGNPQRKSQHLTHPVYKAYKDAQKLRAAAAKEQGVSFKDVAGETATSYAEALNEWLKVKHGFRPSQRTDPAQESQATQRNADRGSQGDSRIPDSSPVIDRTRAVSRTNGEDAKVASCGSDKVSGKSRAKSDQIVLRESEGWNAVLSKKEAKRLKRLASKSPDRNSASKAIDSMVTED